MCTSGPVTGPDCSSWPTWDEVEATYIDPTKIVMAVHGVWLSSPPMLLTTLLEADREGLDCAEYSTCFLTRTWMLIPLRH